MHSTHDATSFYDYVYCLFSVWNIYYTYFRNVLRINEHFFVNYVTLKFVYLLITCINEFGRV